MNITEKTAYLKGLLEGMNLDTTKPEGKLLSAVIETLDEMAKEVNSLYDVTEYLEDYIDEIDYDLGDIESDFYGIDEDDCDCDCDCDCDDEDYCFCDDCEDEDCENCILCEDEDEAEDEE